MNLLEIKTLGELRESGYKSRSVKEELRENLIARMRKNENAFEGVWGYDETVIPDAQRAILSKHDMIFLGLRGQAKTRIARLMVDLLDEYVPYIEGSEINDDPFEPISRFGKDAVAENGDDTPIAWMHRDERYTEKLATPDVSIADLIGDVDPIKAAALKLPYSNERVLHFGLIPRSHRGLFVINELPDLQARIQVALFNILQEGDIQIRGFKLRLPLDIQFVFTANPEDYTNRGSIVTPLKDRIDSQIITHYPKSLDISRKITEQEAKIKPEQHSLVTVDDLSKDLVEQIAIEARDSEFVDEKSGVSARLTISALENLFSAGERRAILNNENDVHIRIGDFVGVIPSITGKIELVYEGEQEGPGIVAANLVGKAIRSQFKRYFPDPEMIRKKNKDNNPYEEVITWFRDGNMADIITDSPTADYHKDLEAVPGLKKLVKKYHPKVNSELLYLYMEFALHGLSEYSLISKHQLSSRTQFKDLMSSVFTLDEDDFEEREEI